MKNPLDELDCTGAWFETPKTGSNTTQTRFKHMAPTFTDRHIAALRRLPLDLRAMLAPLLSLPSLAEDRRGKHWAERRGGRPKAPPDVQKAWSTASFTDREKLIALYDFGDVERDHWRYVEYLKVSGALPKPKSNTLPTATHELRAEFKSASHEKRKHMMLLHDFGTLPKDLANFERFNSRPVGGRRAKVKKAPQPKHERG